MEAGAEGVPQVADGLRKAASLEDAGYSVQEAEPPSIEEAARAALAMLNTPECRAVILPMLVMLPADTHQFLSAFYGLAGGPEPVAALSAFVTRQQVLRGVGRVPGDAQPHPRPDLNRHPIQGRRLRSGPRSGGRDDSQPAHDLGRQCPWSARGAVPVRVADGLPQVIQLIGPRYREDLCLDAAAALEERLGILTPINPREDRIQQ